MSEGNFEEKEEEGRPCARGPPRSAQCSSARPPHERWDRRGSSPGGRCRSWSDLTSLWRESSLWERMISCLRLGDYYHIVALIKSPPCFQLLKLRVCVCECLRVTYLVTSKSGKRILFLMKMVKLRTSSIGLLGRMLTEEEAWGWQSRLSMGEMSSGAGVSVCVCVCVCVNLTSWRCRSQPDTIHQSHTDPRPEGKRLLSHLVG